MRKDHPDAVSLADAGSGATVSLAEAFNQKKYRLFEVSEDILKELQSGEARIVGDDGCDAVLCTADKTYEIKKVETSNAVCLVPTVARDAPAAYCIEAIKNDFFELRPIAARLEKLKSLLKASEYRGQAEEVAVPETALLSLRDLEERVQASAAELQNALKELGVVEYNGNIRLIAGDVGKECAKQLLDVILENGWDLANISLSSAVESIDGADQLLLEHALSSLGRRKETGGDYWELDQKHVAVCSADLILWRAAKEGKIKFPEGDFLQEWEAQTPGTGARDASLLEGTALKEGNYYIFLPRQSLASGATARFTELFNAKAKWTAAELRPYIVDLFGSPGQLKTADELLLQHTRHIDGHYSAK